MFPKYICINEVSILQSPNSQGKHLLNLTAVSLFFWAVITDNKRLHSTAPIITQYKFCTRFFFTLNSCDGKTIFLKADWLCMSTTVLKCDPAIKPPDKEGSFYVKSFGYWTWPSWRIFVLLLRNKCVLFLGFLWLQQFVVISSID